MAIICRWESVSYTHLDVYKRQVLDYIVNGARQSVQFFIFSKDYEKIADRITKETHRGVTVLDGIRCV